MKAARQKAELWRRLGAVRSGKKTARIEPTIPGIAGVSVEYETLGPPPTILVGSGDITGLSAGNCKQQDRGKLHAQKTKTMTNTRT